MGLSFHYNGKLKPTASLKELVGEAEDIARIYNWKYTVHNTDLPAVNFGREVLDNEIYGITISPPECEPFSLSFLSNGRMSSPMLMQCWGNEQDEERKQYRHMISVKTQYAGIKVHIVLIELLKYIAGKYLEEINVEDEGQYWETGDDQQLAVTFNRYNAIIDNFSTALESFPVNEGETIEQYLELIFNYVRGKM